MENTSRLSRRQTAATGALPDLDPVIHAHGRLKVMTVLVECRDGSIAFPQLQSLVEMTSGNLSTHLRRLEEAGYVRIRKGHMDRTPVTWVAMTPTGLRRYSSYIDALSWYLECASRALAAPDAPGGTAG